MHSIATIQTSGRQAAQGRATDHAEAAGTGLPDFAALLGLTLATSEKVQKTAAATGASPQTVAGVGQQIKADAETVGAAADDATAAAGTALAAAMQGLPLPAKAVKMTADTLTSATTATLRNQPQVTVFGKSSGTAATGKTASNPATPAKTLDVKAWNVIELNHQLKAAVNSVVTTSLSESTTAAGSGNKPQAASFLAQVKGDKIRTPGTQNLLRPAADGKATAGKSPSGPQKPALQPPLANNEALPGAGVKLFGAAAPAQTDGQPEITLAEVAAAAPDVKVKAAGEPAADPENTLASPAAPLVWTPKPVATGTAATRMPGLSEQVRQVADYMAERTEGVVRMSDHGMDANLRLYPPDLGGVRVQLNVQSDGTAQAQFIVERAETAQLLQQHMRSFQQGMESHGIAVSSVKVTLQSTTVQPASAGAGSDWRQENAEDSRGQDPRAGERNGQSSKRQGRPAQEQFEG